MRRSNLFHAALAVAYIIGGISEALAQSVSNPAPTAGNTVQGFSIVLVLGELQSGATPDNIPAAARRALADLKDFLPYKGYRLLDTAWTMGGFSTRGPATTRVGGPGGESLEVRLDASVGARKMDSTQLNVRFRLVQSNVALPNSGLADQLHKEASSLKNALVSEEAELNALKQKLAAGHPDLRLAQIKLDTWKKQLAALETAAQTASVGPSLIDTSFNMNIGETVVVGTSRVQGDKALIAILTAVPRSAVKP